MRVGLVPPRLRLETQFIMAGPLVHPAQKGSQGTYGAKTAGSPETLKPNLYMKTREGVSQGTEGSAGT